MTRGALVAWLRELDADELAEVLRRRPDAVAPPAPADLTQLAVRLSARAGLDEVVARLPLPALQVVEALARLGVPAERTALAAALERAPGDAALDATLRVLAQRALVWPDGDRLWAPEYLVVDANARRPPEEPFEPVPPGPPLAPADRTAIRAAAVEAATELLERVGAFLGEAAEHPLAQRSDGGVAARELTRLGAGPLHAELVLAAGLLGPDGLRLRPTAAYGGFAGAPAAERLTRLLEAWWTGPALRQVVVRVLNDLPPDTALPDPGALAPLVRWTAPLPARRPDDLAATVADVVAEGEVLGVCALGGISPLGRALADGRVAEVAAKLLPEPPTDLRVRTVASVVLSDDVALLDEVAAALRLRRLAPTVAGSARSAPDTITALRAAGYAALSGDDVVSVRRNRPAVDAGELARRLSVPSPRPASPLEQIQQRAPQLRSDQARLLADAVEHGTPVWIRYVDAAGRTSDRVIENAELAGSVIEAFCRLRRDDRAFTLDKIVAVARPRSE
ncbi:hypothetical protein ACFFX1_44435 [Dactylosporangium sucinum]|uniref:Helicase XPB/Ssl2 N-terminal domain-containing protein n=1 Tax=Dactylosporangium sucinum TaxID=1424081 RepID=A0A917TRY5_9ACTN|nr:hypothetical protein [Dactylosporangium sucinum]GGM34708.1 hypothetical protein GCM10007977_040290 [Dactylosporangium sucinum]